jgi:hypothetical protein
MAVHRIAADGGSARSIRTARSPIREPTLIISVQRAPRLLGAVGIHLRGATGEPSARAAGLPRGTTYHLLHTLTHESCLPSAEGTSFHVEAAAEAAAAPTGPVLERQLVGGDADVVRPLTEQAGPGGVLVHHMKKPASSTSSSNVDDVV